MLSRAFIAAGAVTMLLLPASAAWAQPSTNVPGLSVAFAQPTGTGTTTSSFDVVLRLAVAAGASPFVFSGSSPQTFGLPASFPFPTEGQVQVGPDVGTTQPFKTFSFANINASLECTGNFTDDVCGNGPGPYTFTFNTAPGSLVGLGSLSIAPGTFRDFLFGTFTPTGGAAPPGIYTFFNAIPIVQIQGFSTTGQPLNANVDLADTCENEQPSCAFTRTVTSAVTAAPEPATFGLVGLGLGVVATMRRRRRNNLV